MKVLTVTAEHFGDIEGLPDALVHDFGLADGVKSASVTHLTALEAEMQDILFELQFNTGRFAQLNTAEQRRAATKVILALVGVR